MKSLKKVVLLVLASALVFLGSANMIMASSNSPMGKDDTNIDQEQILKSAFENMSELASNTTEVKDLQVMQEMKDKTSDAISNKEVVLNNSNGTLDFDDAKFLNITQNDVEYTSITVPITGEKYSFTSNFTLIFDSNDEIVNYSEALITKSDADKFVITTYTDGELVKNEETDLDYVSDNELKKEVEGMQTRGVKKIAGCIAAVAGVNAAVAYLIAGTCIASCPAVPPVCAACIAGVAAMGAADVAAVVSCFKL